jgi:hypothetical protein
MTRIDRALRAAYLRWECIRRSKYYRLDCEHFVARFDKWFSKRNVEIRTLTPASQRFLNTEFEQGLRENARDRDYYDKNISPYLFAFWAKWGFLYPYSPTFTYDPRDLANVGMIGTALPRDPSLDLKTPIQNLLASAPESIRASYKPLEQQLENAKYTGRYEILLRVPDSLRATRCVRLWRFKTPKQRMLSGRGRQTGDRKQPQRPLETRVRISY